MTRAATGAIVVLLASLSAELQPRTKTGGKVTEEADEVVFRLSEGAPEKEAVAAIARPPAEKLDEAALKRVLDRLPPLPEAEGDVRPFALREGSLPPPRTGRTVAAPFPPPPGGPGVERPPSGPLEVRRRAPDGDVPL